MMGFCCSLSLFAEEITEAQALEKAQQILKGKQLLMPQTSSRRRAVSNTANPYYVFNAKNNGGFVVIAGDDRMPEVLGYAEQGNLDLSQAPDNVKWLFDYYAKVAQSLKDTPTGNGARRAVRNRTNTQLPELIPLMSTKWNQDGKYRKFCPIIDGDSTLTGCVATAMAQVVNYFQWPLTCVREAVGYTFNGGEKKDIPIEMESLPARKFNWFGMTDDDIAWLMRYCGQSVMMNYGSDESAAYGANIPGALISVFNFSKGVDLVKREEFTDDEWEQVLYKEIELGRPVIYSGFQGETGHTFVLHGYKYEEGEGRFFINWGWGGRFDGYFALTNLKPDKNSSDFSEKQDAVVGIQPTSNNDISYDEKPEIGFREVHVAKQGQLASLLPKEERYLISRLKITGEIGGADIDVIHDMSEYKYGNGDQGRLSKLDLSEARIVGGENYSRIYASETDAFSDWIFAQCRTLTSIVLPKTLKKVKSGAFSSTNITSIVIPKSVTYISGDALRIEALSSIQVEEGNEVYYSQNNAIYEKATGVLIRGCKASGIPEGVVEIGTGAFIDAGLESIALPKSLKKIGAYAFSSNTDVKELYIPAGVEEIGGSAFYNCKLNTIIVDEKNPVFDSRNNCNAIIETATNKLILASNGTTQIPAFVTAVGDGAFANNDLKLMDIPQTVTSIGQGVFTYSKIATFVVHYPTPIDIRSNTFAIGAENQIQKNARLIVPDDTEDLYSVAPGWDVFKKAERSIVEASDYAQMRNYVVDVTEAGKLESLIPAAKKTIIETLKVTGQINGKDIKFLKSLCGQYGMLTSIDLSDAHIVDGEGTQANQLPESAFTTTFALEHIVLPSTLTAIGDYAFQNSGLKDFVLPK